MGLRIIHRHRVKPPLVEAPDDSGGGDLFGSKVEMLGCFLCYDKIRVLLDVISSLLIQVRSFQECEDNS